jgi:hypothetical protein
MEVLGCGRVLFSHLKKLRQSVLTLRRKLHSSQFNLARSRWRSGGQKVSDMKCLVIVISPEGGMVPDLAEEVVFESPELVFKPEEVPPLGVLVDWMRPLTGPEADTAVGCEVEPAEAGVKLMLEDI